MKVLPPLGLAAALGLAIGGCASARTPEQGLERFDAYLASRAAAIGLETPATRINDYNTSAEQPIFAYKIPGFFGERSETVLHVNSVYLQGPDVILEHGAMHELCHVKLGHQGGHQGSPEHEEIEAERCTLQELGMDHYIRFVRAMGKDDNHAWVRDYSRKELEHRIISAYGGEE